MTTFTKNKQTGEFDIVGLADTLAEGREVNVAKKDGSSSKVIVGRCSKPFIAKFGPNEGQKVVIAKVQGFAGGNGGGRRGGGYQDYCYYPCPVSGRKCCPENGPCHDCM